MLHCTPWLARVTRPQIDDRRLGLGELGDQRGAENGGAQASARPIPHGAADGGGEVLVGPPPLPISGGREIRGSQPDSPPPLASPFRTRFQLDSATNGKIFTSLCNFYFLLSPDKNQCILREDSHYSKLNLFMLHKFKHFFKTLISCFEVLT